MKNHHTYGFRHAASDIGELLIRTCSDGVHELRMGGDGDYKIYTVDAECEIPEHYKPVLTTHKWAWVYDDFNKVAEVNGEVIQIFRAGRSLIVQVM